MSLGWVQHWVGMEGALVGFCWAGLDILLGLYTWLCWRFGWIGGLVGLEICLGERFSFAGLGC